MDYTNIALAILAAVLTILSLVRLGKHKKSFLKYPEQIKQELFKDVRNLTFLNILSIGFVVVGYMFLNESISFVFLFISLFISGTSLLEFNEDHGEEYEEQMIKEKENKIKSKLDKQQKKTEQQELKRQKKEIEKQKRSIKNQL